MAEYDTDVCEEALWAKDSTESSGVYGVVWTGSEVSSECGVRDVASYSALCGYGASSNDCAGASVCDFCAYEGE